MDILWIVDAQKDFIDEDGKLTVNAPDEIRSNMKKVLDWGINNDNISIGLSRDWHEWSNEEISKDPDYEDTYPEHCMAETKGAELITELKNTVESLSDYVEIKKTVFDVWDKDEGGPEKLEKFVEQNKPDNIYVMGVATDVCVRFAVLGFLERYSGKNIYVIQDAIWGIEEDRANDALQEMKEKGAKFIKYDDLPK